MMKTISLFSLVTLAAAIPAPNASAPQIVYTDFSWVKWVDDIMTNPDTALSPEQALASYNATLHASMLAFSRRRVYVESLISMQQEHS